MLTKVLYSRFPLQYLRVKARLSTVSHLFSPSCRSGTFLNIFSTLFYGFKKCMDPKKFSLNLCSLLSLTITFNRKSISKLAVIFLNVLFAWLLCISIQTLINMKWDLQTSKANLIWWKLHAIISIMINA